MARPDQEAIETFMSITGVSELVAVQKLEEHNGDLNEAVNAHFNEGDRNLRIRTHEAPTAAPQDDVMDIDEPIPTGPREPPFSFLRSIGNSSPFSQLDPDFSRRFFSPELSSPTPFVSHPREVREIPIEVKDGGGESGHSGLAPKIEDVTEIDEHGPETHGTVIIDEDDDANPNVGAGPTAGLNSQRRDLGSDNSHGTDRRPSAPDVDDLDDYHYDIEEEMVRAAIEASKREDSKVGSAEPGKVRGEDPDLAHAASLSLKVVEQEKPLRELGGPSDVEAYKPLEAGDMVKMPQLNGRLSMLDVGSSFVQDEADEIEEQPLVRHRSRPMPSALDDPGKEAGEGDVTPSSSHGHPSNMNPQPQSGSDFHEWGGISSEEHDEALMLEAAMFGGIPETSRYRFPYAPHQFMQNGFDRTSDPRPPSPGLVAQRLIREQQDDEYLASLQADREKAEARRLEELAAREASLQDERRKEEDSRRKLEADQEIERQLAVKEASLPQEPTSDDENAITLLVRMPDGSRCGRRFLKSDKLQYLFDFLDVGKLVKPGSYRLVRPYPRLAFSYEESSLSLNELGLTSKQEALFLEAI